MPSSRKPQLTNPVKLSKPELHEKRLSLGRWHLQKKHKNFKNSFLCSQFITISRKWFISVYRDHIKIKRIKYNKMIFIELWRKRLSHAYCFGVEIYYAVAFSYNLFLWMNSGIILYLGIFDNRPSRTGSLKGKKVLRRIFSFRRHTSKMLLVREYSMKKDVGTSSS